MTDVLRIWEAIGELTQIHTHGIYAATLNCENTMAERWTHLCASDITILSHQASVILISHPHTPPCPARPCTSQERIGIFMCVVRAGILIAGQKA